MLANKSIQYTSRQNICENKKGVTVEKLRDFLATLVKGGCGNFKVVDLNIGEITHYYLNGHRSALKLD